MDALITSSLCPTLILRWRSLGFSMGQMVVASSTARHPGPRVNLSLFLSLKKCYQAWKLGRFIFILFYKIIVACSHWMIGLDLLIPLISDVGKNHCERIKQHWFIKNFLGQKYTSISNIKPKVSIDLDRIKKASRSGMVASRGLFKGLSLSFVSWNVVLSVCVWKPRNFVHQKCQIKRFHQQRSIL